MRASPSHGSIALSLTALTLFVAIPGLGQSSPDSAADPQGRTQLPSPAPADLVLQSIPQTPQSAPAADDLLGFKESDVKFDLRDLMETLSDRRHEGWVLAAYPDPKTSRPLIGAGFSLDLPARAHAQRDPLNSHPFLEPASADLWRIAGLDASRLDGILAQFNHNLSVWKKRKYQKKIPTLTQQITDDEANQLLRVAALQAIYNARAYCRNFDRFSASQQMALAQLVYQMGVNLEEFSQFLNLINSDSSALPGMTMASNAEADYWKAVQDSLIHSQWARLYRVRATAVIAMLDPQYAGEPSRAEREVSATLRPAIVHRRKGRAAASLHNATLSARSGKSSRKKKSRTRSN
ncbi:MAG: hypothetical protein ABSF53_27410 [Terracidiphilus sp.]|jgi:hypothetical protein